MDEKLLKHGAFSWFELMTTDVEAAKMFYSELLGWTTKDMPMENMTYAVVQVEGQDVGGIMNIPSRGWRDASHLGDLYYGEGCGCSRC